MLWVRVQSQPDGGTRVLATRLSDDGLAQAPDLDVSEVGSVSDFGSNAQTHWVGTTVYLADGGAGTRVAALGDDGHVLSSASLDGFERALVPTPQGVAVVTSLPGSPNTEFSFLAPNGTTIGRGAFSQPCAEIAGASKGDEVWLGCGEPNASFRGAALVMLRLSADGGSTSSVLWPGDGGRVDVTQVVTQPLRRLFFERVFTEVGRGEWRATYALPLSSDGLSAEGEAEIALTRPSSQFSPSFASRQPGAPNALAWNDDRQLPREPLLEAARVFSNGRLGSPTSLERLTSDFTSSNANGRFIASDGTAFLLTAWNGFEVTPIEWAFDGGTVTRKPGLTTGFSIFGPPLVAPATLTPGSGYLASWLNYPPPWVSRSVDSHGNPLRGQMPIAGEVLDILPVAQAQLVLTSEVSVLRLSSIDTSGVVTALAQLASLDAGITAARMAQSGSTLLVSWQAANAPGVTTATVFAARFNLDGAPLDARAASIEVPSRSYFTKINDIGVRNGLFHILGTQAVADGGSALWVWRLSEDGGVVDSAAVAFEDIAEVSRVAAGPTLDDGSLLIAYSRKQPGSPTAERVYARTFRDSLAVGGTCERATDCVSGFCVGGFCCATADGCSPTADGGPTGVGIYQLGCQCQSSTGPLGALLWLMAVFGWRRRLRSA